MSKSTTKQYLDWRLRNKDRWREIRRKYRQNLKVKCFNAYGGCKCSCCYESNMMMLSLDHINNDGYKQRKELNITGGYRFYQYLRSKKYPEGYQVLCMNCQFGRKHNKGICPHKV